MKSNQNIAKWKEKGEKMGKRREALLEKIVSMQEAEIERLEKAEVVAGGLWYYRNTDQKPSVMVNVLGDTSWQKASVETIRNMLAQHYARKLSIYDFWGIGDEREIHLGGEIDETVQFVLTDKQIYYLPACNEKCAFTVDQKNALENTSHCMNENGSNKGGWKECDMRKWLDATYTNALPKKYEWMFKDFVIEDDTIDKFSLRSEMELFGRAIYGEDLGGKQIEWYKQTRNRIKLDGSDDAGPKCYWERSPYSGGFVYFCIVNGNGSASYSSASNARGVAPFGCI